MTRHPYADDSLAQADLVAHLSRLAGDAYALARTEVFDREPVGADPANRTAYQQRVVEKLERAELELAEARAGLAVPPAAPSLVGLVPAPRRSVDGSALPTGVARV